MAGSALDTVPADEARARLVDQLIADQWITSPAVRAAFRRVPRHLFATGGFSIDAAYANDVVITSRGPDGRSDRPRVIVLMCHEEREAVFRSLEELGARPVDVTSELTTLVPRLQERPRRG